VAWNETGVYTMALDGSRRHLVLAFTSGSATGVPPSGALSPGGSRIAYYIGKMLSAADLATGRRVQLGQVSFDGWRNNTTILASANDGSALLLVNAATGNKSAYLSLTDRALARAYQKAWPHAGRLAGGFGRVNGHHLVASLGTRCWRSPSRLVPGMGTAKVRAGREEGGGGRCTGTGAEWCRFP